MTNGNLVSDAMTRDPRAARDTDSVHEVANLMSEDGVGVVPVCNSDDQVLGVLTDRDIVVKVIGQDMSPDDTYAGSLIEDQPVTVPLDTPLEDALEIMMQRQIRRLPVTENDRLVGILAMADLATRFPQQRTGELARALSFD